MESDTPKLCELSAGILGGVLLTLFLRVQFTEWFRHPRGAKFFDTKPEIVVSGLSPATQTFILVLGLSHILSIIIIHTCTKRVENTNLFATAGFDFLFAFVCSLIPSLFAFGTVLATFVHSGAVSGGPLLPTNPFTLIGYISLVIFDLFITLLFAAIPTAPLFVTTLTGSVCGVLTGEIAYHLFTRMNSASQQSQQE